MALPIDHSRPLPQPLPQPLPRPLPITIYDIEKKTQSRMTEVKFAADPQSQAIAKKIFPPPMNKTNDAPASFRFTNVSIFSVTPQDQSEFTANLLDHFYTHEELKTKILTDVGAGVGGNVWSLAKKVRHVNCVEMDPLQSKILAHNMDLLETKNLTIHTANYVEVRYEISQDILFADPPWGGLDYKNQGEYITEYEFEGKKFPIDQIVKTTKAELVMLKLPINHSLKCFEGIKKHMIPVTLYAEKQKQGRKFTSPLYQIVILSDQNPNSKMLQKKKVVFPYFNFRGAKFVLQNF